MIDIQEKKNQIIKFLENNGPSLPVQVSREIKMEPVFASAILSELISSGKVKTSHMKIGSSPLYLLPGHEEKLESQTDNLKSAEKEAQEKLKSKTILTDEQESPATRVALRNLKDFATPFKFQDKIMWKYTFTPQEEIDKILFPKKEESSSTKEKTEEEKSEDVPKAWEAKKEGIKKIKEELPETNEHTEQPKKIEKIFEEKDPKTPTTLLEKVERLLKSQNSEITSIEEVDKKKVIAIVKSQEKKSMLFAFSKLRITESELLSCYKQASKKNLPYRIITKSDQTKKLTETINAYKNLIKIEKL